MYWTLVPSPVDDLLIAADEQGLCGVGFAGPSGPVPEGPAAADHPVLRAAADQLAAYFAGRLTEFTVPLSVRRGSRFERAVWAELARIPFAETRTYGQVAAVAEAELARLAPAGAPLTGGAPPLDASDVLTRRGAVPTGDPAASDRAGVAPDRLPEPGLGARAVGVACNRNPLPIVVPCHRVVGAGRKLVGFGGGLDRKRFLLELEARVEMEQALR